MLRADEYTHIDNPSSLVNEMTVTIISGFTIRPASSRLVHTFTVRDNNDCRCTYVITIYEH